jgi:hypothetical protein
MRNEKNDSPNPLHELDDEDRAHITDRFFDEIVPQLIRLDARLGTINCEFAGREYKNWNIEFRSEGTGFDIVGFYYDKEGTSIDLDL